MICNLASHFINAVVEQSVSQDHKIKWAVLKSPESYISRIAQTGGKWLRFKPSLVTFLKWIVGVSCKILHFGFARYREDFSQRVPEVKKQTTVNPPFLRI